VTRARDRFGLPVYATEADLCAAFIAWASPHVQCYAEWAGWDILLVYPDGYQLGIQAKLRLNAEVIRQAAPDSYETERGPDFRGILVPTVNPLSGVAYRLGLVVFHPWYDGKFRPALDGRDIRHPVWSGEDLWTDWNPGKRHELPPVPTDAIAGSPCPITLTPWKLAAIDVLAELQITGTITTKRMRALGVSPSRWLSSRWLIPGDKRGVWLRGDECPPFDAQHPKAFAAALEKASRILEPTA
jgi:hypothetical protein